MIDMPNGKIDKKKSGQEVDILKEEVKELK